jgi:hypothetical protein
MKVLDNFLSTAYQDAIESSLLSADFPWYLNSSTMWDSYSDVGVPNTKDIKQFTHGFYKNGEIQSQYYGLVTLIGYSLMLTKNIDTTNMLRIKANLNTPQINYPDGYHLPPHVDFDEQNIITCVYYVNDSDGDTIFFADDYKTEIGRVSPKKGRLVYFDSKTPHAGCPPKEHHIRCLINFNFKLKEIK